MPSPVVINATDFYTRYRLQLDSIRNFSILKLLFSIGCLICCILLATFFTFYFDNAFIIVPFIGCSITILSSIMNAYIFSAKTRLGTFLSNPAGYRYFIAALDLPLAVAFGMYVYLCINAPSDNRIKPTIVSFTVLAFLALLSAGYFETTMRSVYISAYLRAVQIRNRRNQRRSRNTNTPTNTNANVESSYVDNYSNPPVANPNAMPSRSAVDEPPTAPMDPPPYDDDDDDDVKPLVP